MINKIIRRLFYGNKADSKAYIEYLRGLGMKIGEETTIYMIFAVLAWNRIGNRNVQTGNESVVRED